MEDDDRRPMTADGGREGRLRVVTSLPEMSRIGNRLCDRCLKSLGLDLVHCVEESPESPESSTGPGNRPLMAFSLYGGEQQRTIFSEIPCNPCRNRRKEHGVIVSVNCIATYLTSSALIPRSYLIVLLSSRRGSGAPPRRTRRHMIPILEDRACVPNAPIVARAVLLTSRGQSSRCRPRPETLCRQQQHCTVGRQWNDQWSCFIRGECSPSP